MSMRILWAVVALMPLACKTTSKDSESKAVYTDSEPQNGETWTRARLRPLNRFAHDLLGKDEVRRGASGQEIAKTGRLEPLYTEAAQSLRNRGIDPEAVLPLNKSSEGSKRGNYHLFLAEDSDHCFFEGSFDRDIYWNSHKDEVKTQIEFVARFIKEFHVAIEGDVEQPFVFNDIEICSKKQLGAEMKWRPGGKLEIGIPYSHGITGGHYKPLTPAKLMDIWTAGDMFVGNDQITKNLKTIWPIVNPMSRFRRQVVKRLKSWAAALSSEIKALQGTNLVGPSKDQLMALVNGKLTPAYLAYAPEAAIDRILAKGASQQFLAHWMAFVNDRSNHEGLIAANMAAASEKIKVRNRAEGWLVSVANYHRIAVEGSVATGQFKAFVKVDDPREVDIDISCRGAIAVCTIDDVSVLLQYVSQHAHFDKSLETAGFDHAVKESVGAVID